MTKETVESDKYKWIEKEPEFKWNNNPMKFINALKSPESMAAINQCNQFLEAGLIRPSYHAIQGILISAAEKSLDVKQASMNKKHINKKNKIHRNV